MNKTCKKCQSQFEITQDDLTFYDKISPVFSGKKYQVPSPTFCPDCRQQRRLSCRNERKLYKRNCDMCKKNIISIYSPDKLYTVYCRECWWSDKWNPLDYGKDFDFNRGFFEQFKKLLTNTPLLLLFGGINENSEYVNCGGYNKNSYLCFDVGWLEDCYYVSKSYKGKKSLDLYSCLECENSYELIDCVKCNNCLYLINTESCFGCYYCFNCSNCNNCFLSSNLINKSYCIENKQYSKDEYFIEIEKLKKLGNLKLKERLLSLILKTIHKLNNNLSCENVLGDYLKECHNAFYSFDSQQCKDIKYSINSMTLFDSYDDNFSGNNGILNYDNIGCEQPNKCRFNIACWQKCSDTFYSYFCHSSNNLFGCIGLRNKSYCILNKQYTKEEYEKLVPKIIECMMKTGEWGEFFPSSISPFGYNETVAQEYFPLSENEAKTKGFNWSTYEAPFPKVDKIISKENMSKLPDNIKDIPDDILNWALTCEVSGKPYKIIKQELDFYRKHNIPVPRRHPDQRHLDRMKLRNPRKLYDRKCNKCGTQIKTTYSPDRPEIVYCESCYNKEVY